METRAGKGSSMPCRGTRGWWFVLILGVLTTRSTNADQFELLDGPMLGRMLKGTEVMPRHDLSLGEIGAMTSWLRDSRSALVLVRTEGGNPARLLLVPELRKPASGDPNADPTPVLVVERLDTFDGGDLNRRVASRRDVVLFDGMPLDVDSGQVVPVGQGGDLVFRTGQGEPRLEVLGSAALYTLSKAPTFTEGNNPRPSPGRTILPADFAGRYRLFANGQWSGRLDLNVEGMGVVSGQFRSDLHGTSYPVTGQIASDVPGKVRFAVALPRTRLEFDGYLYGEGKGAMAGTVLLLDRTFGFFAVRDGGRYAPEGRDLGPMQDIDRDQPGMLTLDLSGDGTIHLQDKPTTLEHLTATLQPLVSATAEIPIWVSLKLQPDVKVATLEPVVAAIRAAGVQRIRLDLTPVHSPQP